MRVKDTWRTFWRCLICTEHGEFQQAATGGAAEKHMRETGHPTTTSTHPIPDDWGSKR